MNVILYFLLAPLLVEFCCASNCTIKIDKNTVGQSWQTSSFRESCFANLIANNIGTHAYFHSENFAKLNDSGFSWFVIELKERTKVTEIGIQNRNDCTPPCNDGDKPDLNSRASEIEIFTSNSTQIQFNDKCRATDIGSKFNKSSGNWKYCGKTPQLSEIQFGDKLPVRCNEMRLAKHILLRKKVNSSESDGRQYMSFNDMWIVQPNDISILIKPSEPQLHGSNVTIKCISHCTWDEPVHLCSPGNQCNLSKDSFRIDEVKPSDSGNYTCKAIKSQTISSAELNVLYPVERVQIIPISPVSCGDLRSSRNVEFQVISNAAYPVPTHNCSAWNRLSNKQLSMQMKEVQQSDKDKVNSTWLCSNCSSASKLTVNCNTTQSIGWNRSDEWKCDSPGKLVILMRNISSCEVENSSAAVEFEFNSDAADPIPIHSCKAWNSSGMEQSMKSNLSLENSTLKVTSLWRCPECIIGAELTVECRAFSSSLYDKSAEWNSKCAGCEICPNLKRISDKDRPEQITLVSVIATCLTAIALIAGVILVLTLKHKSQSAVIDTEVSPHLGDQPSSFQLPADDESPPASNSKPGVTMMTEASPIHNDGVQEQEVTANLCEYATVGHSGTVTDTEKGAGTGIESRFDFTANRSGSQHSSEVTVYLDIVGDGTSLWGN